LSATIFPNSNHQIIGHLSLLSEYSDVQVQLPMEVRSAEIKILVF